MSFYTLQLLAFSRRKTAERYALIDLYIVTNDRGLANNDSGSMVNKEIFADGSARMDINPSQAMRVF